MTDLAVVILTFNEEANLPDALESVVGWARQVFVVDSFSTDATVDVALSRAAQGVEIVQHRFQDYASQWKWSLESLPIEGEWVLKLDADERVTAAFRAEVDALLPKLSGAVGGLSFRREIEFEGRLLRFGGHRDNWDVRLWRRRCGRVEARPVNEHMIVDGEVGQLRSFVRHSNLNGLSDWIEKHNRYSSLEAICALEGNPLGEVAARPFGRPEERRKWLRLVYQRLPMRNTAYFLYRALLRGGFLDGWQGVTYAFLHATYLHWVQLKVDEARRTGKHPAVAWPSRGAPDPRVTSSRLQRLVETADARSSSERTPVP